MAVGFPDFPGIVTGGYSLEEAVRNSQEALELTMDTMKKHKILLPKPKTRFSGQFNVRVPKGLRRELVRKAEEEGVTPECTHNLPLIPVYQDGKSGLILPLMKSWKLALSNAECGLWNSGFVCLPEAEHKFPSFRFFVPSYLPRRKIRIHRLLCIFELI